MGSEMTAQDKVNEQVALLVGRQAIELIAMQVQIEILRQKLEAEESEEIT